MKSKIKCQQKKIVRLDVITHTKKTRVAKTKRIRKNIRFYPSRTGKNLELQRGKTFLKFKKIRYLEDENQIFKDKRGLLKETIHQKNDNDVDSEPEIVKLGTEYLYRKLNQSIQKERELYFQQNSLARRAERSKPVEKKPEVQISDFFKRSKMNFNTPSDNRHPTNDAYYVSSMIEQQKKYSSNFLKSLWGPRNISNKTTVKTQVEARALGNSSRRKLSTQLSLGQMIKISLGSFMDSPAVFFEKPKKCAQNN